MIESARLIGTGLANIVIPEAGIVIVFVELILVVWTNPWLRGVVFDFIKTINWGYILIVLFTVWPCRFFIIHYFECFGIKEYALFANVLITVLVAYTINIHEVSKLNKWDIIKWALSNYIFISIISGSSMLIFHIFIVSDFTAYMIKHIGLKNVLICHNNPQLNGLISICDNVFMHIHHNMISYINSINAPTLYRINNEPIWRSRVILGLREAEIRLNTLRELELRVTNNTVNTEAFGRELLELKRTWRYSDRGIRAKL